VFSPNGELLASASGDHHIRIWNVNTGEQAHKLEGHTNAVTSAAFSSCGKFLSSGSADHTVRIWDIETGRLERILEGHTEKLNSVVFSPDNKLIGSVAYDMTLRIWAADSGELKNKFENRTSHIRGVAFSHDGMLVMSASEEGKVLIWSITGQIKQEIDIGVCPFQISFCFDNMYILTDVGMLAIQRSSDATTTIEEDLVRTNSDNDIGYGISRDRSWITKDGKGILWLPVEYRPSTLTISESTVIIGCGSGHVLIMRFE
jgi:WD40 repeat protein